MYEFDLNVTEAMVNTTKKCVVMVKSCSTDLTKNGNEYVKGEFIKKNKTLEFRVWDAPIVSLFKTQDMKKQILVATLKFTSWSGAIQATIQSIHNEPVEVDTAEFLPTANYEALFAELGAEIQKLQPQWVNVINLAFQSVHGMDAFERFKHEFAGCKMHDALEGGLIHHTVKMLRIYNTIEQCDPRLAKYSNLIRTGIILHDLGKIEEMHDGEPVKDGYIIPHRIKGAMYLERNRGAVLSYISEEELVRLESILIGHHNAKGNSEAAGTIYAYIVFLIDMLDAQVSRIMDCVENPSSLKTTSAGNLSIGLDWSSTEIKGVI